MHHIEKIKVGTRFWLSILGAWIGFIGFVFLLLFILILSTGNGLPVEMSFIYYAEVLHEYVYYGFGISLVTTFLGVWLYERRIWTKTDLIIDGDGLEFTKKGKTINLPRQRILKLLRLKSFFLKRQ